MYILYTKKYKCVFVMFSRCWSKTMINWIGDINNIPENLRNSHKKAAENKDMCLNSFTDNDMYDLINDDYRVYIMVRNPYDRLLSTTIAHRMHNNMSWSEFVNKYDNHHSIIMSHPKILNLMKKRKYKILYFENFNKDLNNIKNELTIPHEIKGNQELFHDDDVDIFEDNIYDIKLGEFQRHIPKFKYFYNEELQKKVYNMFKDDFINFKIPSNIDNLVLNLN